MTARVVGKHMRWARLAEGMAVAWLFASACAEPATVDPNLVPEASVDARRDTTGDADPDATDASTGGTGGSGGTGGTGGSGGVGGGPGPMDASDGLSEAGDVRNDAADASTDPGTSDAGGDAALDASAPDGGTAGDATTDPVSDPSVDAFRADAIVDASADRDGG